MWKKWERTLTVTFFVCISLISLLHSEYILLALIAASIYAASTKIGSSILQTLTKQQNMLPAQVHSTLPTLQQQTYYFERRMLSLVPKGTVFLAQSAVVHSLNLKNAYHILISGKTGNGKTTLLKQLLLQMVLICDCYFVHPMFAEVGLVEDDRVIEVWTPIAKRLRIHPNTFKDNYTSINDLLLRFELLLHQRAKEKGTPLERTWKKQYLFIDEGPLVVAQCPDAKRVIGRIVREGRQLHIFLALSTQGAQVQTLGINTADLAQFGTKFYLGGCDSRTRKEVMPTLGPECERAFINKGILYYTAPDQAEPQCIRLPLMRNEVLFECFGETFHKAEYTEWFDEPVPKVLHATNGHSAVNIQEIETLELGTATIHVSDALAIKITAAIEELLAEEKQLTLYAIQKRTGLNWTDNATIFHVAQTLGFEIVKGKGGPRKKEDL